MLLQTALAGKVK